MEVSFMYTRIATNRFKLYMSINILFLITCSLTIIMLKWQMMCKSQSVITRQGRRNRPSSSALFCKLSYSLLIINETSTWKMLKKKVCSRELYVRVPVIDLVDSRLVSKSTLSALRYKLYSDWISGLQKLRFFLKWNTWVSWFFC